MFRFNREVERKVPVSPVAGLLIQLDRLEGLRYYRKGYDFEERVQRYLRAAQYFDLDSDSVVASCIDLAETYTDTPEVAEVQRHKRLSWEQARSVALSVSRDPIEIDMELDPIYFAAILSGEKTYEGRAYKPESDKNYPDLRANDRIRFRMSRRRPEFADDAVRRGLQPEASMLCTIAEVYFAPTVHGMYQIPMFNGLGFQPMIEGDSEILQLQRAAVYHTFPGYHELIEQFGFLGIQVKDPQLLTAS